MTLSNVTKTGLAAILALGLGGAGPALAQQSEPADQGLASSSLAVGEASKAIRMLQAELREYPNDPALLINLGIAHAQSGDDVKALTQFEAALRSREVVQLDTADGRTTDSRKLARQAIAMLERGEFRPSPRDAEQVSLRNR